MKKIPIPEILKLLKNDIIHIYGEIAEDLFINNLADRYCVNNYSIDWTNPKKSEKQEYIESSPAKIFLADESIAFTDKLQADKKILIIVKDPKYCIAKIGNAFFVKEHKHQIHPKAIIHENAQIGLNVNIGPFSVIGECVIGDNSYIGANVIIEDEVIIGKYCNIKSGAIIGGCGFGFERDDTGNYFRFPQIGRVIIGDYVDIGSNTCIDRGALSDTTIGNYSKIDNLIHIAHNNHIGQNVFLPAHSIICGSCIIEDNAWIAPNSAIREGIHIGANAKVGLGSTVIKDVPSNETWFGSPAKKSE